MNNVDRSKNFVALIDILYAVVIASGFFSLARNLALPRNPENFLSAGMAFFAVAMFIAIRDWSVYHKLIAERPHKNATRFALDILILFSFFLLLQIAATGTNLDATDIKIFSWIAAAYFFFLLVWGGFEWREYGSDPCTKDDIKREIRWSFGYSLYFWLWAGASLWWPFWYVAILVFVCFIVVDVFFRKTI